ncbi:MAG: class III extradiol ring-cleavage dioxygenase [Spongiibacteraceae bacterium]|jgi:aromatic ring-opening dioxygenase catalytic subunit (LigB family)|nr:class III extradiol ring-cleavage dioxygenase [Spongiibacteraceae bacterium]
MSTSTLPSLYIPHGGGPCFFMDDPQGMWTRLGDYLRGLPATLPARPKAIVLISGHWVTPGFTVTGAAQPELIYDYYNFPPHTYELQYPAPGAPELAARIVGLLQAADLPASIDARRGFDHGMFIPLKLVCPAADVPVVQLSLRADYDPAAHLRAGAALAALRAEGVLILGSGMSFHNMRAYGDPRATEAAAAFDAALTAAVESAPEARRAALRNWETLPAARLSHPPRAEEHFMPLLVAAGAGGDAPAHRDFTDEIMNVAISAFRFG